MSRVVTNAVVLGGVLLSLGLIAVSATLNFRMAYRMGDSVLDGWIYGGGAATADVLKALLPFCIWWAWRRRQALAALAGALLLMVFATYSLTASIGYASQMRASHDGERQHAAEQRAGFTAEMARLERQLQILGPQRGESEIAAEIELVLASPLGRSTLGQASDGCKTLGRWSRQPCAEVAGLRQELARAAQARETTDALREARDELARLGSAGAAGAADPQVAALVGVMQRAGLPLGHTDVRLALLLLVGALFELGSGLGLYVATVPWRSDARRPVAKREGTGAVEQFALEQLEPRRGRALTLPALFAHYERWCGSRGEAPLPEGEFAGRFAALARQCGIAARDAGGKLKYLHVAVGKAGTAVTNSHAVANSIS